MKYRSRIGKLFWITTVITLLVIVFVVILGFDGFIKEPFSFLPLSVAPILFAWIIFDTSYTITSDKVIYRSAFIRGKIPISSIRKIEVNKTLWAGLRPAMDTKGIVIYYNRYDEIYFSPEKQNEFIQNLQKINPEIQLIT